MARRPLAIQTFSGKSLDQIHRELIDYLDGRKTPTRIEDALTDLGYSDPFARETIKRSFVMTLKPGGTNERLTREKKWLRNREKWADGIVDSGKVELAYAKTTVPTSKMLERVEELNGQLSLEVQESTKSIASLVAERANSKLDKNTIAYLMEDVNVIISDNAAKGRELQLHETYRQQNEKTMEMLQSVIAELTGRKSGEIVRQS